MGRKRRLSRGRKRGGALNFNNGSVIDDSEAGTDNDDVFAQTNNSSINSNPNMAGVDYYAPPSDAAVTALPGDAMLQNAGSSRRRKRRRTKKRLSTKRSAKRSAKRRKSRR
jgi:hypothetical protein